MSTPIDWGIASAHNIVEQQRIRITNTSALVVIIISLLISLLDLIKGLSNHILINASISVAMLVPLLLNRVNKPVVAQFSLVVLILLAIISNGVAVQHAEIYRFYLLIPLYFTFHFFYGINKLLFRVSLALGILSLLVFHFDVYVLNGTWDSGIEIGYWSFTALFFIAMLVNSRAGKRHEAFITTYNHAIEQSQTPVAFRRKGEPYFYRNAAHIREFPVASKQVRPNDIYPPDLLAHMDEAANDSGCYESQFDYQRDRQLTHHLLSVYHIQASGEDIIVESCRNITDLQNLTQQLEESNQQLQETIDNKDRFFSILAHDLRSPIASMLSLTRILKGQPDLPPEKVQQLHDMLLHSNEKTLDLLDSLLTWSKLQRGQLQPEKHSTNLADIAQHAAETVHQAAANKNIQVQLHNGHPAFLMLDKTMMETAARNLVSNAVKYCHAGDSVTISTWLENQRAFLSVKDTGIGMSPKKIQALQHLEEITSTKGTNGETGTALGIAIVQKFLQIHGGKLHIESTEGEGSEFIMELPVVESAMSNS